MTDDARSRLLKAVHAERRRRGLDDTTYRDLVERETGQRSAKELSLAELGKVLTAITGRTAPERRARRAPPARARQIAKLRALWFDLWALDEVRSPRDGALAGFFARATGIATPEWAAPEHLNQGIEGLKAWLARAGVVVPDAQRVTIVQNARMLANLTEGNPEAVAWKAAVIGAQWNKLLAIGALQHRLAGLGSWLFKRYGVQAPHFLSEVQGDQAIEQLGTWLRGELAKGKADAE